MVVRLHGWWLFKARHGGYERVKKLELARCLVWVRKFRSPCQRTTAPIDLWWGARYEPCHRWGRCCLWKVVRRLVRIRGKREGYFLPSGRYGSKPTRRQHRSRVSLMPLLFFVSRLSCFSFRAPEFLARIHRRCWEGTLGYFLILSKSMTIALFFFCMDQTSVCS